MTTRLFAFCLKKRSQGFFKVDDLHELYYEESGNPSGNPVLVVHGGPGEQTQTRKTTKKTNQNLIHSQAAVALRGIANSLTAKSTASSWLISAALASRARRLLLSTTRACAMGTRFFFIFFLTIRLLFRHNRSERGILLQTLRKFERTCRSRSGWCLAVRGAQLWHWLMRRRIPRGCAR